MRDCGAGDVSSVHPCVVLVACALVWVLSTPRLDPLVAVPACKYRPLAARTSNCVSLPGTVASCRDGSAMLVFDVRTCKSVVAVIVVPIGLCRTYVDGNKRDFGTISGWRCVTAICIPFPLLPCVIVDVLRPSSSAVATCRPSLLLWTLLLLLNTGVAAEYRCGCC